MENTKTDEFDLNVQDYMWRTQIHQLDRIRYFVGKLSEYAVKQEDASKLRDTLNTLEEVACYLFRSVSEDKSEEGELTNIVKTILQKAASVTVTCGDDDDNDDESDSEDVERNS